MENRAQVTKLYPVDIFTALQPGTLGTFTDNAPTGYYSFTGDGMMAAVLIPISEFKRHFKYYQQATIF